MGISKGKTLGNPGRNLGENVILRLGQNLSLAP